MSRHMAWKQRAQANLCLMTVQEPSARVQHPDFEVWARCTSLHLAPTANGKGWTAWFAHYPTIQSIDRTAEGAVQKLCHSVFVRGKGEEERAKGKATFTEPLPRLALLRALRPKKGLGQDRGMGLGFTLRRYQAGHSCPIDLSKEAGRG